LPVVLDALSQLGWGRVQTGKVYLAYGRGGVGKNLFLILTSLSFASQGMRVLYLMPESVDVRLFPSQIGNEYAVSNESYGRLSFLIPEGAHPEEKIIRTIEEVKPSLIIYQRANALYSAHTSTLPSFSSNYGQLFAQFLARIRGFVTREGVTAMFSIESSSTRKPAGYAHIRYFSDYLVEFGTFMNRKWVTFTDAKKTERRFYTIDKFEFQVIRAG
jgi:hypothetical protein